MTEVDSGSRAAGPSPAQVRLEDPAVVRAWAAGASAALRRERAAIDRVNVFPVADADTGTNLSLTLREGELAVRAAPEGATGAQLLAALARAALLGARGNSGVILSEWLRGLAVAARRGGTAADLLGHAAASARSAVERPAEGTILTAADAAATAARSAQDGGTLPTVTAAADAAREAARASRDVLDALRTAGVLDAGALGLVLVLDALVVAVRDVAVGDVTGAGPADGASVGGVSVVRGTMDAVTLDQLLDPAAAAPVVPVAEPAGETAGESAGETVGETVGHGALELMFVLGGPSGDAADAVADGLRAALAEVGDSVVVVGGDAGAGAAVWQGHVHTDRLDQALAVAAAAARTGSLSQVHVRHLEAAGRPEWGVVAATGAPALAAELARAGAVVLLTGGVPAAVDPLTADDVARAAASTGARRVLVLGDEAAALAVEPAVAVAAPTDVHAVVALAALGTVVPLDGTPADAEPPDARAVVAEALAALTVLATRAEPAPDALRAACDGATTVVTALLGADVPPDLPDALAAVLAAHAPEAELVALPTGLPGDGVHLGVERVVDGGTEEGTEEGTA